MKTTGALIAVAGILFTIFTTFGLIEDHFIGGNLLATTPQTVHSLVWEPLLGAIIVLIGAGIYTIGRRITDRLSD